MATFKQLRLERAVAPKKVDFNGIKVRTTPSGLVSITSLRELESHLSVGLGGNLLGCELAHMPCDEVKLTTNGMLVRKKSSGDYTRGILGRHEQKYALYEHSLYQLFNFLQIPLSFAKRIPSELLIHIVNKLLSENYDRNIKFRVGYGSPSPVLAVYSGENRATFGTYPFFSVIRSAHVQDSTGARFAGGTLDGLKGNALCVFKDKSEPGFKMGAELFYSDGFDVLPTVSGVIKIPRHGYAILKGHSYPLDVSGGQSTDQVLSTAASAIVRIYDSLGKYSSYRDDLMARKVTEGDLDILESKSSKMIGKPLDIWTGMTFMDVFSEGIKRQNRCKTLLDIRRAAIFCGWLIENVGNSLKKK